jgi:hypothetical protein
MQILEKRSQRYGGNRALAGRNQVQQNDDTEALTLRQACRLCQLYPVTHDVALTLARLAYATRAS